MGATLQTVMGAIANLTLKVDEIGRKHKRMTQLACEDSETSKAIIKIREAENIVELTEATKLIERFYDKNLETGVLRCLPCYHCTLPQSLHYKI